MAARLSARVRRLERAAPPPAGPRCPRCSTRVLFEEDLAPGRAEGERPLCVECGREVPQHTRIILGVGRDAL